MSSSIHIYCIFYILHIKYIRCITFLYGSSKRSVRRTIWTLTIIISTINPSVARITCDFWLSVHDQLLSSIHSAALALLAYHLATVFLKYVSLPLHRSFMLLLYTPLHLPITTQTLQFLQPHHFHCLQVREGCVFDSPNCLLKKRQRLALLFLTDCQTVKVPLSKLLTPLTAPVKLLIGLKWKKGNNSFLG